MATETDLPNRLFTRDEWAAGEVATVATRTRFLRLHIPHPEFEFEQKDAVSRSFLTATVHWHAAKTGDYLIQAPCETAIQAGFATAWTAVAGALYTPCTTQSQGS